MMSPSMLILTTCFAPFAAFLVSLVFFIKAPKVAQALVLLGGLASVACAGLLLVQGPLDETIRALWFQSGAMKLEFGYLLDGLSLWFGFFVALITFCIQVYSLGYMSHDPAKSRYFAMLGLFGWAMLSFVYAADLLQAFIFWELVGLASFFLIGFWYEKPSAAAAARKAFVMTRIGDVGLFIGLMLIYDWVRTFDLVTLLDPVAGAVAVLSTGQITIVTLLIFWGIMGKSAQFPLHTWLPDAMEGPTPVSALLHSATMVAAGVFLFARLHPLFMASQVALTVVLSVATVTVLLSATMAMVENDIKKVLAYSSIGQLGFMLMGLASGSLLAGVFHLITHAVFKALLFLCAGSYIHHFETNDLAEIGRRGGRRMKVTTLGLVVGGAALAGVPPLAGFFSKEAIIGSLGHHGVSAYLVCALFAASLTAYYTFRMIFLIVLPAELEQDHGHGEHHGEAPASMLAPMLLLTAGAGALGFAGATFAAALNVEMPHHSIADMAPAVVVTLAGIALAWWDFGRAGAARTGFVTKFAALHKLFINKWYVDEFYNAVVARATDLTASVLATFESKGFDRGFDGFARSFLTGGRASARTQSGMVQLYLGTTAAMLALVVMYLGMK